MIKFCIYIFALVFSPLMVLAEVSDLKKIYNLSVFSSTSLEINDTNLIDNNNAIALLKNVQNLKKAVQKKSKEIKKKNKNRTSTKYKGAEDIYNNYAKSVVFIGNRKKNIVKSIGSGLIIKKDGLKIITNWHVIDDADSISIWLKPDQMVDANYLIDKVDSYSATLINIDKKKDLAMLSVERLPIKIKPIKFAKFNTVKPGQNSFVIGHPKELLWSFNSGMISQVRPNYNWNYKGSSHYANVIQTQAPLNEGNSGGPLFNKENELIGINTFTRDGENLNFAIAIDDVIEFINEKPKPIKKKKSTSKYIKKKNKGNTWIKKKEKKSSSDGINFPDAKEADINNNGKIDTWLIDENSNGIYEKAYSDTDEDGVIDLAAIDKNEDQNFEIFLIDENQNGDPEKAEIDEDENGVTDVIAYDYNEDGEWDKFENV